MTRLWFTIGIPGAGKSWYWKNKLPNTIYISSDDLREKMFGDVNDQSNNDAVFNEMMNMTVANLNASKSCYYDATNLNQKRRIKFLNALRQRVHEDFEAIALVFAIPFDTCVRRNLNRERTVPSYVMDRMYRSFQVPAYCEGWSEIYFVHDENSEVDLIKRVEALRKIPHDNHHHSLSIGDHMIAAGNYAMKNKFPIEVVSAAFLHDVGKGATKVFTNRRGVKTEEAHYYGHENVGAYDYITSVDSNFSTIEIANLIQLHMSFYNEDNRIKNLTNLYGEAFMEKLRMLHEADEAAH